MKVDLSDVQLENLIENVVRQVVTQSVDNKQTSASNDKGDWGVFEDMNDAVEAAQEAFLSFKGRSKQCRKKITDAVRQMALDHKEELSKMTVEETGMGRVDHKIAKYVNAAENSPGVEDLQPQAWSGKNGLALDEYAPFGVIGNISPSTHPGPVIINNIIIMLAGGNTITFNAHPGTKNVSAKVIQLANQYMVEAGGPPNLATCVKVPTLETAEALFGHEDVTLLSVTGGPMVVDMALKYPKKLIAAGPGNPPVLIDETADLDLAAKEITISASFDNNILCIAEKEIIIVESVYNDFMKKMAEQGNFLLSQSQMSDLADKALYQSGKHWLIDREHVGRSAHVLGKSIGLNVPEETPLLIGETSKDDRWVVAEQMTCCIPVVKVGCFKEGLKVAQKAEHRFRHTSSIFTQDLDRATIYSREMDCTVNVINGGTLRGNGGEVGEAYFAHTIATPTGEGITKPLDFVRKRRIMTSGALSFV